MKKTINNHNLFYFCLLIVVTMCSFSLSGCDGSESQPTLLLSGLSQEKKFVSAGYDGTKMRVSLSVDGTSWTRIAADGGGPYLITYGNGKLVGISQYSSVSRDGIFWQSSPSKITTYAGITAFAYGKGVFIAAQQNVAGVCRSWISRDGITWSDDYISFGTMASAPYGMAYGNGIFIIVGSPGLRMRSADGINWTDEARETSVLLRSVAYGNGRFIAVGDDGVCYFSTDKGVSWIDGTPLYNSEDGFGIAYGNGVFVVVGTNGLRSVTTDGLSWTSSVASGDRLSAIAYGNGIFVAVGSNGRCIRSADNGVTWTNDITETGAWSDSITYME